MTHDHADLIDPTVELGDVEDLLAEYALALAWMASYTRVSPHCRWRKYEAIIRNIVDRVKYQRTDLAIVPESDARNAYYEAVQLRAVYRQFKDSANPAIGKKLALIAKGNERYTDEDQDARSRDAAFELFLAASFQETGLRISLGDDTTNLEDFRVLTEDFDLYVECKRPKGHASVRPYAEAAFKQLEKRLANADPARPSFGAVAFAVDRAMNPNAAFIEAATSRYIQTALTSRTAEFIKTHAGHWHMRRPPGVIMAFVELCGSAYVGKLPFGIFSSVVTVDRFPVLLTEDGRANLRARDYMFKALAVDEE